MAIHYVEHLFIIDIISPGFASGILAHADEKLKIKRLFPHIQRVFIWVWAGAADNIACCTRWYMSFILMINIEKYHGEKNLLKGWVKHK